MQIPLIYLKKKAFDENNATNFTKLLINWMTEVEIFYKIDGLADEKLTLHELAEKYEISAERVRQIEKNAMKKVKLVFLSEGDRVLTESHLKSFVLRKGRITSNQKHAYRNSLG